MRKQLVTYKFDEKYISAIKDMSERLGLSKTDVVRKAIRILYKRSKTLDKKRKSR